ncbi:phospholipase A and acyltransferase 1-like, partial [Sphaerodactylus townsendi]|uniref:phospholipase A and acyltransferase 1-like n=1 Tax=Sphaerodactylus townsendi TaxID=933632 RepID=UPI0020270DB5
MISAKSLKNDKRQIIVCHKRAPKPIRFKAKEKVKPKLGKAVKERMFHWNNQKKPKRGDLIEIFRPVCQHWGIYVGNGNVIHLLIKSKVQGIFVRKNAVVEMEPLKKVVGNDKYRINNKYDIRFLPRPREEIIVRAIAKVGKVTDYSIFTRNCEHFVTKLRYGKAVSAQ